MPTENINIETQVQSAITRADLLALIAANTVKKKIYHITDALSATATIAVFSRSTNQVSYNAMNLNTGKFGMYFITFDVFNPIIEGDQAVQSYIDNTYFPPTGNYNTVYLDLSTGDAYAWNGTTYFALSGGNVYEPTVGDFPLTGDADTLYIATDTGVMYLWDGSAYVALNSIPYIPLAGTQEGNPVTGQIQISGLHHVKLWQQVGTVTKKIQFFDDENFEISWEDSSDSSYATLSFNGNALIEYSSSNANYQNIVAGVGGLANVSTIKSRIWTKAGTPTTTDDDSEGYVVGSLIWDTTNSIWYRCTDATAGAAVWTYNDIQSETIRAGASIPASTTRYLVPGMSGFATSISVNIAEKVIHLGFRVMLGSALPGSGGITVTREFTSPTGTVLQSDTLTIPAGSAVGEYIYSGPSFDARAVSCNLKYTFVNAAPATSGSIQGIERTWVR
jgi:hypothetical protein